MKYVDKMIEEIHSTVVKGSPADDKLFNAAEKVVKARYKSSSWDDLSDAINELADVIGYTS